MVERIAKAKENLALAEAELKRLDAWMEAGASFVELMDKSSDEDHGPRRSAGKKNPLMETAEKVMRGAGPLHTKKIIPLMNQAGWASTVIYIVDMKNLVSSFSRDKRFKNHGRNIWEFCEDGGNNE